MAIMGLDEITCYKNRLLADMLSNKKIVRLLHDDLFCTSNPHDLVYKQVFPYTNLPDTVEHGTTYICCEVDILEVTNDLLLIPSVYIWVFTHESKMRLPNGEGIRTDSISSEIVKTINGSRYYGMGELKLSSAKCFSPISNYQGRTLIFRTVEINRLRANEQSIPINRREWL